jgi:hypothetical protein
VTSEQAIVLGFIAAAFVVGWLVGALIGRGNREAPAPEADVGSVQVPEGVKALLPPVRIQTAVDETRRELDRAIRAYHAAIALWLEDGRAREVVGEETLAVLARSVYALAMAVGHAADELAFDDPRADALRESGVDLRRLAEDVMLGSSEREDPTGVFDRLEQQLMAAAAAILPSGRLQASRT